MGTVLGGGSPNACGRAKAPGARTHRSHTPFAKTCMSHMRPDGWVGCRCRAVVVRRNNEVVYGTTEARLAGWRVGRVLQPRVHLSFTVRRHFGSRPLKAWRCTRVCILSETGFPVFCRGLVPSFPLPWSLLPPSASSSGRWMTCSCGPGFQHERGTLKMFARPGAACSSCWICRPASPFAFSGTSRRSSTRPRSRGGLSMTVPRRSPCAARGSCLGKGREWPAAATRASRT